MSLQETIRKVLREESRLKQTVEKYISQFGKRYPNCVKKTKK
jgi:hypothetical protein